MHLDIRTMMVMIAVTGVIAVGTLLVMRRLHLGIPGIGWWVLSNGCGALGSFLGGVRGLLSEAVADLLFSILVLAAPSLLLTGCRIFVGRDGWGWLTPAVVLGSGAVLAWFDLVQPSAAVRMEYTSAVTVLLNLAATWTLVRGDATLARRVTGFICLLQGVIHLVRGLTIAWSGADDLLAASAMTEMAFMTTFVYVLCITLGQVVMVAERLHGILRSQVSRDPLTGVFNRRAFAMLAEREISAIRRSGESLAALMMDLDHFKQINDRFGHAVGDAALCRFTAQVSAMLRDEDIFCRFGGEEFVALLPRSSASAARAVAERVREAYAHEAGEYGGRSEGEYGGRSEGAFALTVSIGIAEFTEGDTLDTLLRRADAALYRAKASGRNRTELAGEVALGGAGL